MKHSDFHIGLEFWCGGRRWRCTDVGSRAIVAIPLDERTARDPSWAEGPPFALAECVFDEHDLPGCTRSRVMYP